MSLGHVSDPEAQIDRYCHQVLQLEQYVEFPDALVLRQDTCQDSLFTRLFSDEAPFPLPPRYRLKIIKDLIAAIERSIEDWDEHGVSDGLVGCLAELVSSRLPAELASIQQKFYVTYHLSLLQGHSGPAPSITLLESRSMISAPGTTGLRTWEAALHLGQYLCLNPGIVKKRRVLELGAGTGYLATLCAKHLGSTQVIASDGSKDIVNFLPENFVLNGLQDSTILSAVNIEWGHDIIGTEELEWNTGRAIDITLGADITYERNAMPALLSTLQQLFDLFPALKVLICATERNKDTHNAFIEACRLRKLAVNVIEFNLTCRKAPFYSRSDPIHICWISQTLE